LNVSVAVCVAVIGLISRTTSDEEQEEGGDKETHENYLTVEFFKKFFAAVDRSDDFGSEILDSLN